MANSKFTMITVICHDAESIRYVNKNSIEQIFEKDDKIFIEIHGSEPLQVKAQNIHEFMDRFIE